MKCVNGCADPAEVNFKWPTSLGQQSANLCGACAAMAWSRFGNTDAFQALIISEPEKPHD